MAIRPTIHLYHDLATVVMFVIGKRLRHLKGFNGRSEASVLRRYGMIALSFAHMRAARHICSLLRGCDRGLRLALSRYRSRRLRN
jgi:hypothetical protein